MTTLALPTAASSPLDARVEDAGGLFAFVPCYLGYAYFYFYLSLAGGP